MVRTALARHGGWKPVQRQRRWERSAGVPHKRRPGLQSLFGRDLDTLIVLLGGGTNAHHQREIEDARDLWQECIRCKQQEE